MNNMWMVFLPLVVIAVGWLTVPIWGRALDAWWDFLDAQIDKMSKR